jgi:hypothetical protein
MNTSVPDFDMVAVATLIYIAASIILFAKLHFKRIRARNPAPKNKKEELADASHRLNNEATRLQSATRGIASSEDPIRELLATMRPRDYRRAHSQREAKRG